MVAAIAPTAPRNRWGCRPAAWGGCWRSSRRAAWRRARGRRCSPAQQTRPICSSSASDRGLAVGSTAILREARRRPHADRRRRDGGEEISTIGKAMINCATDYRAAHHRRPHRYRAAPPPWSTRPCPGDQLRRRSPRPRCSSWRVRHLLDRLQPLPLGDHQIITVQQRSTVHPRIPGRKASARLAGGAIYKFEPGEEEILAELCRAAASRCRSPHRAPRKRRRASRARG